MPMRDRRRIATGRDKRFGVRQPILPGRRRDQPASRSSFAEARSPPLYQPRPPRVPVGRPLEDPGGPQQLLLGEGRGQELQADRQARLRQAAGDRSGRGCRRGWR